MAMRWPLWGESSAMRIALIAHDSRKELMAQFCTAYVRILSENDLIATNIATAEVLIHGLEDRKSVV